MGFSSSRLVSITAAAIVAVGTAACASPPAVRAAYEGDRAALARSLASRHQQGRVTNGEAGDVARAVATREIATATGEDAVLRVREARACAYDLADAFEDRAKRGDAASWEATLALLDAGRLGEGDARAHVGAAADLERAVGARSFVRAEDGDARRKAFLDPSPAVRRAAVRASLVAKDHADAGALLEVARLDPEPIVRTDAVRALARLPVAPPGRESQPSRASDSDPRTSDSDARASDGEVRVNALRDLWVAADEPLREDIAAAFAGQALFEAGGKGALRVLLAQGHGPGVLAAAAVCARPAMRDAEIRGLALAVLLRAVAGASRRDRLHAIAVVPGDVAPARDVLLDAARGEDAEIRVAALARLTERDDTRKDAIRALEVYAAEPGAMGARARLALGAAGDLRVQAWLERDLEADAKETRLLAASGLAALGRGARAVLLLTDARPEVRVRAACTLLMAARQGDETRGRD